MGLAEMAIAGGLGADVSLSAVPRDDDAAADPVLLFSESPTRFLARSVSGVSRRSCRTCSRGLPLGRLGRVTGSSAAAAERQGRDCSCEDWMTGW